MSERVLPDSFETPDLVSSAEPSVVFASLAALCVPAWCDSCTVDMTEGDGRYRITDPRRSRTADGAGDPTGQHSVSVDFEVPADADDGCRGQARFGWVSHEPTDRESWAAQLLVDHAVRTVAWQRSDDRARTAATKVENLQIALESSRRIGAAIGVLMSLHKVTDAAAFDLLRVASQHSHRKVHDVALDVLETGWLDPELLGPHPTR